MRPDTLPEGVARRACHGCRGCGLAPGGVCQDCLGRGTVTVELATGDLARLVRCAECGLLARVTHTALVAGVSVCESCRKTAEARQRFFDDLYAPLGRAS